MELTRRLREPAGIKLQGLKAAPEFEGVLTPNQADGVVYLIHVVSKLGSPAVVQDVLIVGSDKLNAGKSGVSHALQSQLFRPILTYAIGCFRSKTPAEADEELVHNG